MAESTSLNSIRAGIFVGSSLLLLGAIAFVLSKTDFSGKHEYVIRFTTTEGVSGLNVGSDVRVGGMLAGKVEAVASYEKTLQQAFREVADLLVARDTLQQQLAAQQAYASSQMERLRLTEARYQAGTASQLDWLDAQRDHFNAQQSVRQVLRQLYGTTAQLYKALGGGDEDRC